MTKRSAPSMADLMEMFHRHGLPPDQLRAVLTELHDLVVRPLPDRAPDRTAQNRALDRAASTDESSGPASGKRPRRPSIPPKEVRRWKQALGWINAFRTDLPKLAAAEKGWRWRFSPRTIDRMGVDLLREWAATPDAFAVASAGTRFWSWWFCLIGALNVLAGVRPDDADVVDITRFDPGNDAAANRFLHAWDPATVAGFLEGEPAAVVAVELMTLFHRRTDARDRLCRCQYPPCDAFFFDASPTYLSNPAKSCTSSHKEMATRRQRAARPR